MAVQGLIYSNARVKAMENSLLSQDKITRMIYAESLADGVKILYESSYGGGIVLDNPYAYESLLSAEDKRITDFLREAMPENSGLDTFLTRLDYHNLKALIKGKFMGLTKVDYMLAPSGNIDVIQLKDYIATENYYSLPKYMSDAIAEIVTHFTTQPVNPRYIDTTIDRAMYAHILQSANKSKSKSIIKYIISEIDMINILNLFRCMRIDASESFYKEGFIEGGEISDYILSPLLGQSYDAVTEKLRYTGYGDIVALGTAALSENKPLSAYERAMDEYLMDIFKDDKFDMFSVSPIAGFYCAKKIEIKTVRMIAVCLKNKVDVNEIKIRLRGVYA